MKHKKLSKKLRILTLLMPDDIKELLERTSKKMHIPQSAIARMSIQRYCEKELKK